MTQDELRKEVRIAKAKYGISYKQLSKRLGIQESSMYNWLRAQYPLSEERSQQLIAIIYAMMGD